MTIHPWDKTTVEATREPAPAILATIKEPSVSSRIYKYLQEETLDAETITAVSVREGARLPASDAGAVTSFMSRLAKRGFLKFVGTRKLNGSMHYEYEIADRSVKIHVKKVRGPGGHGGSRKGHVQHKGPVLNSQAEQYGKMFGIVPTKGATLTPIADLAERLLNLSAELSELAVTTLQSATTDELLAEIKRRTNGT